MGKNKMTTEQMCKCGRTRLSEFDDAEFICDDCLEILKEDILDRYNNIEYWDLEILK